MRDQIFQEIDQVRQYQDAKHPLFEDKLRMAVLTEEVGEVARAILDGKPEDMRLELLDVAAVAVRWLEMLDTETR